MAKLRGGLTRSRRSKALGGSDPRGYRDPQSDQNPEMIYAAPLKVDRNGRVAIELGDGLKIVGGKIVPDMAYLRTQLGL